MRIKPQTVEHANEILKKFLSAKVIETKGLEKALIVLNEEKYRYRKR